MEPEAYLEMFDEMDLDKKEYRRVAVYILHEFYGVAMSEVASSSMGFGDSFRHQGVREQWEEIKTRLDVVGGIETPERFSKVCDRIHEARTNVTHNKRYDPSIDNLTTLRKKAPDWLDWLETTARTFRQNTGPITPYDAISQLIQKNLEVIQSKPLPKDNPGAEAEIRGIKQDADEIRSKLERVKKNQENIGILTKLLYESSRLREDMYLVPRQAQRYPDPPEAGDSFLYERLDDWVSDGN